MIRFAKVSQITIEWYNHMMALLNIKTRMHDPAGVMASYQASWVIRRSASSLVYDDGITGWKEMQANVQRALIIARNYGMMQREAEAITEAMSNSRDIDRRAGSSAMLSM